MNRPLLLTIVGPTAVGKTSLSIALAKRYSCPIISADSRQMYQEIGIGTAKPTLEEQDGVPHYFVDNLPLEEECSAGRFEREALALIEGELSEAPVIILSGGSGLYVKALLQGLDDIPHDAEVRGQLNSQFKSEGIESLLTQLEHLDPKTYTRIDKENPHRVIRALEVCLSTGKAYSSFLDKPRPARPFDILLVALRRDRDALKARIAERFSLMMEMGWLDEARAVHDKRHLNSLNTVGYKELFAYLDGQYDEESVSELIIRETQRFAKRQMTWFNKMPNIEWYDLPDDQIVDKVASRVDELLDTKGLV